MRPSLVAPASAGRSRAWADLVVVVKFRGHETHAGAFVFIVAPGSSAAWCATHHGRVGASASGCATSAGAKQATRTQPTAGQFRSGSDCSRTCARTEQPRTEPTAA